MHRLWGLAAVLLAAGCLREKVQFCKNGALCPEPLVCTENTVEPFCGDRDEVNQCMGKPDQSPCEFGAEPNGYCSANVCTQCNPNLSYCRYAQWAAMTPGVVDDLYAIRVLAADNVYAAGKGGTVVHWNGTTWARLEKPNTGDLVTLAGSSDTDLYTLVNNNVFRYDGTAWSSTTPAAPQALFGLWSAGSGDVFSVGFRGTTGHFVSSSWSYASPFGENTLGLMTSLFAVWGVGADIFVAGSGGTVIQWNGAAWAALPTGTTYNLRAVGGSSAADVYAAGFTGTDSMPVLLHHTQGAWTDRTTSIRTVVSTPLRGIYAQDASTVFIVGEQGSIVRGAGSSWTLMPQPTATTINAIGGAGNDVFAVGNGGTVLRYAP